ncbi:glycoside-pentoside-hexuronide (GPH):cation symporter [Raineyella fluvialis]|uniref:Sugar transporter n=1 Tax=Raineyella fluvialis TaxID=2662261 RepID=A0A5Q2F8T7_9ACTN|nr:glycoside-pentoside-hexuronide (GPH):cation symporter [Raineyella fluvialis]QGF22871.1 sugar transporter [Raineyella fluvialis]
MDAVVPPRNRWAFAVGTVGRDMVYSMMAVFLIVFLTEVLNLDDTIMWWINGILLGMRLMDAFDDPITGYFIDNTHTRWGQYKPWIAVGGVLTGVLTILLFTDFGVRGGGYVALFAVVYLLWGLAFSVNDLGYWSLLPALSLDPHERERIGALTKVFATVGLFVTVVGIVPLTEALGGDARAWTLFACGAVAIMLLGLVVTLTGVREPKIVTEPEHTPLREIAAIMGRNDQLLWTAASMVLFLIGYNTTTGFGVYFFKYAYRNEGMYAPFAAILGVGQLLGFVAFPLLSKWLTQRQLFAIAMGLVTAGYLTFFFSPMNIIPIGVAGMLVFIGNSFIAVLMIVFLSQCIEYGQWKMGRRNAAITFAVQPLINKVGGAVATAVVGVTVILTGINDAPTPQDVTAEGLLGMRAMMMGFPLALMILSFLFNRLFFRLDEKFHAQIVAELRQRGELLDEATARRPAATESQ